MTSAHRECVHQIDAGLYSVQGAQSIITVITSRKQVNKLVLGHNELGNSGSLALFRFLCSEAGQRYEINEISLNSNRIGDTGLVAIARYLKGNKSLKELFLQNNEFTGDSTTARTIADAVSASCLRILSLTSNRLMSDTFIEEFLPALSSTHLCELHLSAMNITARSLPHIKEYISSRRCKLSVFKCNGNSLGLHAVRSIVQATGLYNYSLTTLELHSNHLMDVDFIEEGSDEELHSQNFMDVRMECSLAIKRIISRNEHLGRETRRQSLRLLRYARTILLHSRGGPADLSQSFSEKEENVMMAKSNNPSTTSLRDLPPEIQVHILSYLSPILSSRQRLSVCNYAATLSTLPPLLPRLVGSTTVRKESGKGPGAWTVCNNCSSGRCVGPLHSSECSKEKEKTRILNDYHLHWTLQVLLGGSPRTHGSKPWPYAMISTRDQSLITKIETFRLPPRWLFVRVETSDGVVGWGEATLEGHTEAVEGAFEDLRTRFVGSDADNIQDIWQSAYRARFYRGGPVLMSALSGLDIALWDIKGKKLGVPVWQLLGGKVRDKVRVYGWIGGDKPTDVTAAAAERKKQGFTAVKMNGTEAVAWIDSPDVLNDTLNRVRDVRSLGLDVGVDFHGRLHKGMAKQLAKLLEPHRPLFIEEPLLPTQPEEIADLAKQVTIPIALGERLFTRFDFRPYLEKRVIDIAQPDVSHCGGISELHRIACLAETYDVALAPHCPIGPIALAACMQVATSAPNFVIQEMSWKIHYNVNPEAGQEADLHTYLLNSKVFEIEGGHVAALQGPGIGVEINEDLVRTTSKHYVEKYPAWRNPVWRGDDGSLREW
ncbi:hypothetical protein AX15_000410 [Amanita polypyramis BW_CC]|nr:hypothetical protein AX15_000410 [Amanita polypyramis BW_CC]